jgi:hypothetical protein
LSFFPPFFPPFFRCDFLYEIDAALFGTALVSEKLERLEIPPESCDIFLWVEEWTILLLVTYFF